MNEQLVSLKSAYLGTEAADYIKRFIGLPYRWGGDDPMEGFDCSGLIHEVLQAHGVEPRGFDCTAHGIYQRLVLQNCRRLDMGYAGCLVFRPNEAGRMTHVAMMIDNEFIVHAAGGGSKITSKDAATKYNAYVRKDKLSEMGESYIIINPFSGISVNTWVE